jgi:hypothetical protein
MLKSSPAGLADRASIALERLDQVMDLILEALDTRVEELCIVDGNVEPGLQKDFPVKGAQRWIINRTPDGRNLPLVSGEKTLILPANVNRLGGTIVNSGERPITLYLAAIAALGAGTATIILEANGGSWDFRLGNLFWCGNVVGVANGGNSEVSIAEV